MRYVDITGYRFGRLVVKERAGSYRQPAGPIHTTWTCLCDCGNMKVVRASKLKDGTTMSCGCFGRERNVEAHRRHGHAIGRRSKEYRAWCQAKSRCYRLKDRGYKNYGARGITMSDQWRESFPAFLKDMGPCPPGRSLERIDVNGNYESANCRWATTSEQHNNRRDNRYVEVAGERMTAAQASRRLGIPAYQIYRALTQGQSIERVLAVM